MTTKKIYPGGACRLEFIVEDTDGLPVPSLDHTDVSSSAYRNITDGVQSSATTATVTSSVASTASVSAGQFVTIDSARGHYAIDVASGAAGSSLDYAEAVVAFTAGYTVTPIQHEIDQTLEVLSATYVKVAVDIPDAISVVDANVDAIKIETDTISTGVLVKLTTIDLNTENLGTDISNVSVQVDDVYQIVLTNLDVAVSVIQSQITALNNLSSAQVVSALGTGTWATAIPWNAAWDTEVQSECADALTAYDPPTRSELTTDTSSVLTAVGDVPTNSELATALSSVATAADMTKALDRLGFMMAQEIGACADAGTSAESYTITIDTTTYTIDHVGLNATGNRGTATLTKS